METNYFTAKETNQELRKALKKSFPGVKFSVTKSSGGFSGRVTWDGGPTSQEVKAVALAFEGSTFNPYMDSQDALYQEHNGQRVRWGMDFFICQQNR
jgi:hypothetical protein